MQSFSAYQGGTEAIAEEFDLPVVPIADIESMARAALGPHFPEYRTFVFDVDVDLSIRRMHSSGEIARHGHRILHAPGPEQLFLFGDRMEYRAARFQHKVRGMYRWLMEHDPKRYVRIDATGTVNEVFQRLTDLLCVTYHARRTGAMESDATPSETGLQDQQPQ